MTMALSAAPNLADPNLADPNLADPNLADPNLADPHLADLHLVAPIDADLAHLSEIGPVDVPQTTTVAGFVISLTIESWAVFGKSMVGMAQEVLDVVAAEFKRVFGLTFDNYQESYLHLGDPASFV